MYCVYLCVDVAAIFTSYLLLVYNVFQCLVSLFDLRLICFCSVTLFLSQGHVVLSVFYSYFKVPMVLSVYVYMPS